MPTSRNMLVTVALPYANGVIHLGHLLEHIQVDIWVRFQRMRGHQVWFICGEDAHGTPIMISAERQGISPEAMIDKVYQEHTRDFAAFNINYDNYYSTHSPENTQYTHDIYNKLFDKGDIITKDVEQCFDPEKNMFLPDRYVKGECPKCGAADQYGDNCENCGATYSPAELKNPVSVLSNSTPVQKSSEHHFFNLPNYTDFLKQWLNQGHLQKAVSSKLMEWFEQGLVPWDISRDAPYFGIEIPNTSDKYFYVWLDAPIGYMASFDNLCARTEGLNFNDYWTPGNNTELHHFIGKDIIYFHALFWPAMLNGSGYRMPTGVYAHGFLTVNGQKMSKSRGTFITAQTYLEHLNPEYLRYYFAAKLSDGIDDIDLNFTDFTQRVNSDLVGKVINIASRCAGFISKKFNGQLGSSLDEHILQQLTAKSEDIAELFERREYSHAVRQITALADIANQYIAEQEPWVLAKDESKLDNVQRICTTAINCFKVIMTFLKPITPELAEKTEHFLNIPELDWFSSKVPLLDHPINPFKPMLQRIDAEQVDLMLNQNEAKVS